MVVEICIVVEYGYGDIVGCVGVDVVDVGRSDVVGRIDVVNGVKG